MYLTGVIVVSKECFLKEQNEHESTLQYKLWSNSWLWIIVAPASTSDWGSINVSRISLYFQGFIADIKFIFKDL